MINLRKLSIRFTVFQSLVIGFVFIALIGAALLSLPIASSEGISQPFIDAFFTATSAVTTTGLVVVDTGSFYSFFGQIVILVLIQIGGLGYMIFIALMVLRIGGKLSLSNRILLRESLSRPTSFDMVKFAEVVIIFTFFFEFIGALALSLYWMDYFPAAQAIYTGMFHSISGFCTAGFSLFSDSFSSYRASIALNLIVTIICIAGGIGFFVLYDVFDLFNKTLRRKGPRRLSIHTKFVLMLSLILMAAGTLIIFISERAFQASSFGEGLLNAGFQSISASTTTGFNTINIGAMSPASLFTIIMLMFIGASPGGTGGGIKTTSFGIMVLFLFSGLNGKEDVNIYKRRIPPKTINKAFSLAFIALLWVILATLILTATEKQSFLNILFEMVSAFGTTGLSTGITPALTSVGKIITCITMLIGRVGPLAIGFSLVARPKPVDFKYAEADILVG